MMVDINHLPSTILLQNSNFLFGDSPISTCQRLWTTSLSPTETSSTIECVESYCSRGRSACTAAWICKSLLLFHTKMSIFSVSCYTEWRKKKRKENASAKCTVSRIQRGPLNVLSLVVVGARCKNVFFTLERIYLHAHTTGLPRISLR